MCCIKGSYARAEQIKQILERLDVRWDIGFISNEEYIERRTQLQQEIQSLEPLPRAMLKEASPLSRFSEDAGRGRSLSAQALAEMGRRKSVSQGQ